MQLSRLKYAVLLALLLLLSSCQDYKGMKARLVNGYQGLDAYCLFVGLDITNIRDPKIR
ncbi:hypothetical protein JMI89_08210 [Frischella sp. Ac48]|uniref:hypothetical protein n=1 Tax=Frischella sp. Ac48 TaxID=2804531 RepID=UPI001C7DBCD8|nr:hypothetical protein [Frischella sp. Ac48]MBX4133614.1 hypothetical protein [Frischella sp. Ac48]